MTEGVRARARAETMAQILKLGHEQLTQRGAAELSVRAIARDLGMASSAMYRYVDSRDALLTALIIDTYHQIGEHAETAARGRGTPGRRFVRTACALRDWALTHPHDWALIYGSPVPGYQAPHETIAAGIRVPATLVALASAQHHRDGLNPAQVAPPISQRLSTQADAVRSALQSDLPDDAVLRCVAAWAMINGAISFELFGQLANTFDPGADALKYTFLTAALLIGFPDVL